MKNKTLTFAAAAVAAGLTTAIVAGAAYAYQGKTADANNAFHPFGGRHGAMIMRGFGGFNKASDVKAAIDAGDYSAFKTAIEAHSPLSYITSSNFSEYVDAYKASENKDFSKMKDFMQKYGPQPTQK